MRKGIVFGIGIIVLVAAVLMLQLTTPHMVGPFGVLAFFVLVYIACACAVYMVMTLLVSVFGRTLSEGRWRRMIEGLSGRKIYYFTSFIALAPVILLGMQSIGSVRPLDVGLLVLFQVLGCFYISRRF